VCHTPCSSERSGGLWWIFLTEEKRVFEGPPPLYVSRELVGTVITLELAHLINGPLFSGKTSMLYYIFILCLIRAQPIVFQDLYGEVFLINDGVRDDISRTEIPGNVILALADAGGEVCAPHWRLSEDNLRVLLISSPKTRQDRKSLIQSVGSSNAVFLMKPWSREDFLVAMFVHILLN
jgi:hypothetical protein